MKNLLTTCRLSILLIMVAFPARGALTLEQTIAERQANLAEKVRLMERQQHEGIKTYSPVDLAQAKIDVLSYRQAHEKNLDAKIQRQQQIVSIAQLAASQTAKSTEDSATDALENNRAQQLYLSSLETLLRLKSQQTPTPSHGSACKATPQ